MTNIWSPASATARSQARSIGDDDAASHGSYSDGSSIYTGSDTSNLTPASDLATKPEEFRDWARRVKLDLDIRENTPTAAAFKPIEDIQKVSKTFPSWAHNPHSPQFSVIPPQYFEWRDRLCSALRERELQHHANEDPGLPCALAFICQTCYHHTEVLSDNPGLCSKRDLHFGVDRLMAHSCQADGDELLHYSTQQRLRLPGTTFCEIDVATTTADGLSFLRIKDFEPYNSSLPFREATSALYSTEPHEDLILVHCVASYALEGTAENQMKMGIVSSLYQKKALGIREHFVFGVFQSMKSFLQVVAGVWQDDEIKIYKLGTYSLRDPLSLGEFYLVLRGIKHLAKNYHDQLKESGPALVEAVRTNPPANQWACSLGVTRVFSRELDHLEQWDTDDMINAFRESTRDCEPPIRLSDDLQS